MAQDKRSRLELHVLDSSSLDATPERPMKKKIRRKSRMPDPLHSSTSRTSSWSSMGGRAKRKLFPIHSPSTTCSMPWKDEEVKALVSFLRCQGQDETWPASKNKEFWDSASKFISSCSSGCQKRTGNACRNKVIKYLRKKFKSPKEAESYFYPQMITVEEPCVEVPVTPSLQLSPGYLPDQNLDFITKLLKSFCSAHSKIQPPEDFLALSIAAMEHLKDCDRSNVVYGLVKALGTMRPTQDDSLMPAKRMPMGLVEHLVNFFCSSSINEICCPDDYRQWLVSMFSLFGTKFVKLYSGPMWRIESTCQEGPEKTTSRCPIEARTNVPGLSERSLQRQIARSGVLTGAGIQTLLLDSAVKNNAYTTWWIKGDGCDVVPGLCESVELKWSGDVDLNDGSLQDSYKQYRKKLDFAAGLGLSTRRDCIKDDLISVHKQLLSDKDFIIKELDKANKEYCEKLQSNVNDSKHLFEAGWKVEELKKLLECCQNLITTGSVLQEKVSAVDYVEANVAGTLSKLRENLRSFLRDLSRQQRHIATHIFVLMISCELRDSKPYAIPVQCLPYNSLNHKQLRRITCTLVKEMVSRGMKVAGFCTDGEFNSIRSQGYTRPLSIFKIRSNIRSKYAKLSKQRMMDMLTPMLSVSGQLVGKIQNPAVSAQLLLEILQWLSQGLERSDILSRLRLRTVPSGYNISPWKKGTEIKNETEIDVLRSILAQLEFSYTVRQYDEGGVPFRTHLHVPEVHPDTKNVFMEREDEGHVLKRIAACTRNGGPQKLQLQRFSEALHDKEAKLTYSALVGSRKQSVEDAERLFSHSLLKFMEENNYDYEADYIRAVLGWRQASDQRGLSELDRCRCNYRMLNFLLDELMPWHHQSYDFSLLEVNRDICVCGFTREIVTALAADIETREWRRRDSVQKGIPPEHPRASTSDDVECFFSIMRDQIGLNFTLKQVQFGWRKVCVEFQKRISPELPFYYFTSAHDRFYEGSRPSFNDATDKTAKKRLPRREQVHAASLNSGRATLPVRGTLTVRPKFHKHPVDIPPPSNISVHVAEHSYS